MVRAKKSLGQHFLTDRRALDRIVGAVSPQPSDIILEIGPGTGALTRRLIKHAGFVTAIEIDAELAERLRKEIEAENFRLVERDALSVDWRALIEESFEQLRSLRPEIETARALVVANLPYYISTAIIDRLMAVHDRLFDLTLMLQNEVVERIISTPGGRDYGYLSVLVQFYCEARKLFEVPPSAFRPPPKVQSAVMRLIVRERPAVETGDEKRFFHLVRAAFAQRRKTLANNLRAARFVPAHEIEAALARAGIDPKRRAETLSLAEFGALDRELSAVSVEE